MPVEVDTLSREMIDVLKRLQQIEAQLLFLAQVPLPPPVLRDDRAPITDDDDGA